MRSCSNGVHLARVHVRVIVLVVDVVCLMLVLSALVVLLAVLIQFVARFSVVGGILFTPPVGDSKLRCCTELITVTFAPNSF